MKRDEMLREIGTTYVKCLNIVKTKNKDYGTDINPFKNFIGAEQLGITSTEKALMVRMTDKFSRMINIIETGQTNVKKETLDDTIEDFINYLAIMKVYLKDKRNKMRKR